jgi:hypothetical protein
MEHLNQYRDLSPKRSTALEMDGVDRYIIAQILD